MKYAIGSTAGTGSTVVGIERVQNVTNTQSLVLPMVGIIPAVTNGLMSVVLTAQRITAIGSTVITASLVEPTVYMVEDMGLLPTSAGTNVT
jgi:hypothetical protein